VFGLAGGKRCAFQPPETTFIGEQESRAFVIDNTSPEVLMTGWIKRRGAFVLLSGGGRYV
jgi:hypothetical protein